MLPEAKNEDLLYVSAGSFVYVFSYPQGQPVGTLGGFSIAGGECVDTAGDTFISNTNSAGSSDIPEYAHGGTEPIVTLSDRGYYSSSCAVDPTTGSLAVTNMLAVTNEPGDVAIYKSAAGSPEHYSDSKFYFYYYCGYDQHGNLYVDGTNSVYDYQLAELAGGSSSLTSVTLSPSLTIRDPGGVQWDGKYLVTGYGDNHGVEIYRLKIDAFRATVFGTTLLRKDKAGDVQFWIRGKAIILPDVDHPENHHKTGFWSYPGGSLINTLITDAPPWGVAVSLNTGK